MPLEEIREKFTLSEMVILAWRSQEQYWQMKNRMGDEPKKKKRKVKNDSKDKKEERDAGGRIRYDDELVDNLPDEWFNEEGELDLRQVPGPMAVKYMNARSKELGLPLFPMIGGTGKG